MHGQTPEPTFKEKGGCGTRSVLVIPVDIDSQDSLASLDSLVHSSPDERPISINKIDCACSASGLVHTCKLTPAAHCLRKWAEERCVV